MAGQPRTAAHRVLAARCPGQSGPRSLSEGQIRPGGWTKVSCAVAKVEQLLGVTWDTCLREEEPLGLRAARPWGLAVHLQLCGAGVAGGQPRGSATASLSSLPTPRGPTEPLLSPEHSPSGLSPGGWPSSQRASLESDDYMVRHPEAGLPRAAGQASPLL